MLKLDRIVLREIRLTLREPFRISSGEMKERRILLCELFDADGASTRGGAASRVSRVARSRRSASRCCSRHLSRPRCSATSPVP